MRSGDTVRVWQKIKEGEKTRNQAFEGMVLSIKHGKENEHKRAAEKRCGNRA